MLDKQSAKGKHLTDENRQEIEECLRHGMSFKDIGKRVGKDQTTISKEVKKHIVVRSSGSRRVKEDGTELPNPICPSLLKAPFVCNACEKFRRGSCGFDRHVYVSKKAQNEYKTLLSEARVGIPLNKEAFYRADEIISSGIKGGQHLYHILQTHNIGISKSAVYRHLKRGYLSISPLDMPRVVKFKQRIHRKGAYIPKAIRAGRTYDIFLNYTKENNIVHWVEMDTLIGRIGGKTIMTMHFTACNFMIGFLMDNKTSAQVTRTIKHIKELMVACDMRFGDTFPLILTDNGGEFADVFTIENDARGQKESSLFFCDPYRPSQKPRVEKNHTLFRDIVPSGSSFDNLSQDKVNLIFSHINSVKRHGMTGRTAYEMFVFLYGEKLPSILGINPIPAQEVCQSPALLKI